jgi:hypothetical protein
VSDQWAPRTRGAWQYPLDPASINNTLTVQYVLYVPYRNSTTVFCKWMEGAAGAGPGAGAGQGDGDGEDGEATATATATGDC